MKEDITSESVNIQSILDAVVSVTTEVPEDALSATLLGTERSGHGVVIRDDGLIVTVGYIVADAETLWVGLDENTVVPAYLLAHDHESGLGLLKPAMPVDLPWVEVGSSQSLELDEPVFIMGSGGINDTIEARVVARQEFAGRWEYLLDEAIYTAPAHSNWGGTALLNGRGQLCGIGSLMVQNPESDPDQSSGNMFVPIETLTPVIGELCDHGRRQSPPRPWFGMLVESEEEDLQVVAVYRDCPADQAGIVPGDFIVRVAGQVPDGLADFYRRAWRCGAAGVSIPLTLLRESEIQEVTVETADRNAFIRKQTVN